MRTLALEFFLVFFTLLGACATGAGTRRTPVKTIFMEPLHLGLQPDEELGLTDFDAATLLRRGLRHQQQGEYRRAVVFFRRLLSEFPQSRFLSAAALNLGVCQEEMGDDAGAVDSYRLITERLPRSRDFTAAAFRQVGCLARLDKHGEARALLDRLLVRRLEISDRIDALVLRGEQQMALRDSLAAERDFRRAVALWRKYQRDEYLDPSAAARAQYRLAELAERRFDAAPLRLPEDRLEQDLEIKAQRLLEAQGQYLRVVRFADPHWATAAGYRIGNLYIQLHRAMQQAPVPAGLNEKEQAVYRDMLRQRTAVLLKKALRVFEQTVELAQRSGIEGEWIRSARQQMVRIEKELLEAPEAPPEVGS